MIENETKQIKVINIELNDHNVTSDETPSTEEQLQIEETYEPLDVSKDLKENSESLLQNVETEINTQENYNKMSVKELKEIATNKNLGDAKMIKNMKKQEVLSLILNNEIDE